MRRRLKPIVVYVFFLFIIGGLIFANHQNKVTSERRTEKNVITTKNKKENQKTKVVQNLLAAMTLEEKIGQLFWARVPYGNQIEDIQTYHLGGYILFGKDFEGQSLEGIKALTDSYQSAAEIPLLIGSDEEGGTVTRISSILNAPFQSPMSLYQSGGLEAVVADTKTKAETLKSVGINAGLFPVADVATDSSAFIYNRTIGEDAKTTAKYVKSVVQELDKKQVGSTLKHFPGYGNNGDSHTAIIRDDRSLEALRQSDFLPFEAGISAGADSVLVSHNILSKLDNVPSSISPKINKILRKELGFNGVIMTDDLDMADQTIINSTVDALRSEIFAIIQANHESILTTLNELSVRDIQYPFVESKTLGSGNQFISMNLTFDGGYHIGISKFHLFVGQVLNDLRLERSNDSGEHLEITNDSNQAVQHLGDFLYDLKQIDFNAILNSWKEHYIR